jgi:hypothetical protein
MSVSGESRPIPLEIDGKVYKLELTINGLVALEELLSTDDKLVTFDTVIQRVNAGSVKHIRAFIWAALQEHHKDITLTGAGKLIQAAGGMEGMFNQISAMTQSVTPDPADVKELGVESERPLKARAVKRNGGTGGVFTSMHGASA